MRDEVLREAICAWSWPVDSHDKWTDESGKYDGDHSWYCASEVSPLSLMVTVETTDEFGWFWQTTLYELDYLTGYNEPMETFAGDTADELREVIGRFAVSIGATPVNARAAR